MYEKPGGFVDVTYVHFGWENESFLRWLWIWSLRCDTHAVVRGGVTFATCIRRSSSLVGVVLTYADETDVAVNLKHSHGGISVDVVR